MGPEATPAAGARRRAVSAGSRRRAPLAARPAWLVVVPALAASAGCSLVFGYPSGDAHERGATCANGRDDDYDGDVDCSDLDCHDDDACRVPAEADRAACRNQIDDDRDGLTDCADGDCLGHCPETDRERCANGVDDDGDGAVDREDLGCWAALLDVPEVRRCASIPPLDVAEPFPLSNATAALDQPYTVRGAAWFPTWTTGDRHDSRLEIPLDMGESIERKAELVSRFRLAPEPRVTATAILSVPADARARLLLVPDTATEFTGFELTDALVGLEVVGEGEAATLTLVAQGLARTAAAPAGPWEIELAVTETAVTASLTPPTGDAVETELPRPDGFGPSALVVELRQLTESAASPFLDDLRVRAGGADPCGVHAAPLFTADTAACESGLLRTTADLGRALAAAADAAGDVCAVVTSADAETGTLALVAARSTDAGVTFTPSGTLGALASGETTSGVGLARDRGRWRAVVAVSRGEPSEPTELRSFTSEDCGEWEPAGATEAAGALGPSLVARDGAPPELHYFRAGDTPGSYELVRADDASAAARSDRPLCGVGAEVGLAFPVTIARLAGELALVYPARAASASAGLALASWAPSWDEPPRRVELPLLAPDRDAGEQTLRAGALVATGDRITLVYSASGRPLPFGWPESHGSGTFVWSAAVSVTDPPTATLLPPFACGDGRCDPGAEDCASCAEDCCAALGVVPIPNLSGSHYSPPLDRAVVIADSRLLWPLPRALTGDYALDLRVELRMGAAPVSGLSEIHLRDAEGRGPHLLAAYRPACGISVYATTIDLDGEARTRLTADPCEAPTHRLLLGPVAHLRIERSGDAYRLVLRDPAGCTAPDGELTVPIPTADLDAAPTELTIVSRDPELKLLVDGVSLR